jgi:hypothetical protein
MNLSVLMTCYNYTKHFARRTGVIDPRRVDRALGYIMAGRVEEKSFQYGSTKEFCDCPDCRYRRVYCKHSIAIAILEDHDKLMDAFQKGLWP